MTKKIRKRRANYFYNGGFSWQKDASFRENMRNAFNSNIFNGAIGAAGSMVGQGISGGLSTGIGNATQELSTIASSAIPGPWGAVAGAGLNVVGGLVNRLFGSQVNEQAVSNFRNQNAQMANTVLNADNYDSLLSQYSDIALLGDISKSQVGKDGLFSNKVENLTASLNRDRDFANERYLSSVRNSIDNIRTNEMLNANYAAFGGNLLTNGAVWDNGVTIIGNGGTHEENPFEGVQMGIDPQGVPNLVEEGEVIFNDYVFSDRMKLPKKLKEKYNIKGETFADAAKELSKESKERPNDPISQRGLKTFMSALAESQEELRIKNEDKRMNRYAKGGKLGNRYEGYGSYDNYIDFGTLASPISGEQLMRMAALGVNGNTIPLIGTSEEIDDAITRAAATTDNKSNLSYLRFAPALMSGTAAFTDLFSNPDYSAADKVASVNIQPALVSANSIGQYLSYKPLDRMFYINQLNKNTAAGKRAIQNTSGGNRAAALAGILAADYNYGENLGKLTRQAEEYNQSQRERVVGFNRQTDMFNSQQSMQAQSVNAQSRNDATKMRLAQAGEVAKLRLAARNAYDARRSNNLNSFITNLGNIGWEDYQREWINSNPALYYNLSEIGRLGYKGNGKKNGGKLKKKRGTTYA